MRFDWFNNSLAGGSRPAGYFSPALDADGIDDLPNWKNTNGRFGVAFDLFGDGQTALKASGGRYVANEGLGITQNFSPFGTGIDFRLWNDLNFDGTPINADGTPQVNEIAASFNPNYGTPVTANRLDPDAQRGTNWEFSSGIEHQLAPGWSVSGSWHRRRFGNFRFADNTSFDASALTPLTFTAPTSDLLPNNGGEVITVYEFSDPAFPFSAGDILTTAAPDDYRTWNGFEVVIDGELPRGGFMTGSWTTGTTVNNFCTDAREESPNSLRFCNNETGYRNLYKLSGALPLPYDTMISGIFQVFPGQQVLANYTANAADIGRPFVNTGQGGSGTVDVELIEPGTQYDDFTTSLQLRFAKVFTLGDVRTRVYMNANNIFNDLTLNSRNQFFGGGQVLNDDYFRPISVQAGRTLSFGVQSSF